MTEICFVVLFRTQSWVTLQPHKQRFSPKPVILKPLKLIKLDKRSRKMKWLYGNPWAFQDAKMVKSNASSSLDDSHAMGAAWDWNGEMPRVPGSKLHDEEEKQRPRGRVKKDWTLKEQREKEDNWADLKISSVVSSGEGSAKSLGKLSPLPVPVRKGVVTARGKREAADSEISEEDEGDPARTARTTARRRWELARSAYRPLPATKRATTAGGEALEIHHDLYDDQKQRSHSDSTLDLSSGEDDDDKPKVDLAHIDVTQDSQVPKKSSRSRRRRRLQSGMPIHKKDGMTFEDFRSQNTSHQAAMAKSKPDKPKTKGGEGEEEEAVLSDEPGMKFEVARDIIEGVFIDYLEREDGEGGQPKKGERKRRIRKKAPTNKPIRREPARTLERYCIIEIR